MGAVTVVGGRGPVRDGFVAICGQSAEAGAGMRAVAAIGGRRPARDGLVARCRQAPGACAETEVPQ